MKVRTLATLAGLLAIGNLGIVLERRHEELLDRFEDLHNLADELERLLAGESNIDGGDSTPDVAPAPPAGPVKAVLYGPGTGKVAVILADGGRTIHASPPAKYQAIADIARTVEGIDVDKLEAQLLADHRGVKHVRNLPPKTLNRAATRLLDQIASTPTGGL